MKGGEKQPAKQNTSTTVPYLNQMVKIHAGSKNDYANNA